MSISRKTVVTKEWEPKGTLHDSRYYTKDEITALIATIQGSINLDGIGPDYSRALDISEFSNSLNNASKVWSPYVYKINVPGYFYFSTERMIVDTDISIILGYWYSHLDLLPTQNNVYAPHCMIWQGSSQRDDYGNDSYLWPLLIPGISTYSRVFQNCVTDRGPSSGNFKFFFIPCKYVPISIAANNFITRTPTTYGADNDRYSVSWKMGSYPGTALTNKIFEGDWRNNI